MLVLLKTLSAIVIALSLFITGVFLYSSRFKKPRLSYKEQPFPVFPGIYHAGDLVPMSLTRCNATDTVLHYQTSHASKCDGGSGETMPTVDVTASPGCVSAIGKINVAPTVKKPTQCFFYGTATVPGMKTDHYVEWRTEKFNVVPN